MRDQTNIWLGISGICGGLFIGRLERAVEILGVHRVLYGTDYDNYEARAFMSRVHSVVKNEEDRAKIFSKKLMRLWESYYFFILRILD